MRLIKLQWVVEVSIFYVIPLIETNFAIIAVRPQIIPN